MTASAAGSAGAPGVPGLAGTPAADRTLVMGVLNVTPDSFSDGGRWDAFDAAVVRGRELARRGADLVDVGGESTRPGAARVDPDVERQRVVPVVAALAAEGVLVSVDTTRAAVAEAAVEAGAVLVNDVSGGLADPAMLACVADLGCAYVAMHWRAPSAAMHEHTAYERGVVVEVSEELAARRDAAHAAGIAEDRLVLDPGIGFAKTPDQSWSVLADLAAVRALGRPVLVGASRKRFLGALLADADGRPREVAQREDAGLAVTALAAAAGAWCVRVHEPAAHRDAVAVAARLGAEPRRAGERGEGA